MAEISDKPIKLNIAFQGGGARLVALIECARQLQVLVDNKKVEIVSVAGTSAGSIVAGLLATGFDFSKAEDRVESLFTLLETKLTAPRKMGNKLLGVLFKIKSGKSIYDTNALIQFLDQLFKDYANGATQFGALKYPLKVVVTDLSIRSKKTYCTHNTPESKVIEAIAHSCSLPFFFHSHGSTKYYVDGGLCENLPVEEFEMTDDIYNIAIGFEDDNVGTFSNFEGTFDYVERVISASINNSVQRSENSTKCHQVLKLKPIVNTLEFKYAIECMKEGRWRSECELKLNKVLVELRTTHKRELAFKSKNEQQKTKLDDMRENLYEALSILEHHNVKYLQKETSVVPYCLFPKDDDRGIRPDKIRQVEVIEPLEPLRCYHVQLAVDVDSIKRYNVRVVDEFGNSIEHKVFEVERIDKNVSESGYLTTLFIFFDKYLHPKRQYKIYVTYSIYNTMILLSEQGNIDYIVAANDRRKDAIYEKLLLVFFCPPGLENSFKHGHAEYKHDVQQGLKPVKGRDLGDVDKVESDTPHEDDIKHYIGWAYEGLEYNQSCCLQLVRA
jgi:predicted acylesterase/phospholipase RssA